MNQHSQREFSLAWPRDEFSRVPYQVYTDPEIYAREQELLFQGPTWNFLALECEIPNPGDYKTTWVGEAPVMEARIITCAGAGSYGTVSLFETCIPALRNAPQRTRFTF